MKQVSLLLALIIFSLPVNIITKQDKSKQSIINNQNQSYTNFLREDMISNAKEIEFILIVQSNKVVETKHATSLKCSYRKNTIINK